MTETGFHDWYHDYGTALGYRMPRIAPYHKGPFILAIMLQDPGGPLAGSGAQMSGEIGVCNDDNTARFIRNELDYFDLPYRSVVLLNALPGYGLRNTETERQRGAAFNNEVIRRASIDRLLVAGKSIASPVARRMNLTGVKVVNTHHPSVRGHNGCGSNVEGKRLWREALASLLA